MIDTSAIPDTSYIERVHHQDGDTQDIINVIIKADKQNDKRFCEFAKQFSKTEAGLKKLWEFVKYKIRYQVDDFGEQNIKLPAALWKAKFGDCKSKTLFINQVLKCLGIDYTTRFTSYGNGDFTHVYTVALLGDRKIIVDSVYDYFNKEAAYTQKKDYMARITSITGLNYKKIGTADLVDAAMADGQKRFAEIQQKKRYVIPQEPLNFGMMSEGEALLNLLIRKMTILGVMQENKALAEQGINIIRNTMRTGKITGVIPDQLQGMAARMDKYLKMPGDATGHGARGQLLNFLKVKANISACSRLEGIGAWNNPNRCLLKDFFKISPVPAGGTPGDGTTANPFMYDVHQDNYLYSNDSICNPTVLAQMKFFGDSNKNQYPTTAIPNVFTPQPGGAAQWAATWEARQQYYYYGRTKAEYRVRYNTQVDNTLYNIMHDLIQQYPSLISEVGNRGYHFSTEAAYNLAVEELKQRIGVLSNWANDLFRADSSLNRETVGSGMLYTFIPETTQAIGAINTANFPSVVQTKMVLQQQFLDSCTNFSGISNTIIKDMAENGVLFDSGGESPQRILAALVQTYNPNISCPPCAVIVPIVLAIIAALPAIILACNGKSTDARLIDQSAADTAQFHSQSSSTIPGDLDFLQPSSGGGGSNTNTGGGGSNTNTGGGSNTNTGGGGSGLVWAGLAAGGLWLYNKKKKN